MAHWVECGRCQGMRVIVCLTCLGIGAYEDDIDPDDWEECFDCLGDGEYDCDQCDGSGGWFEE